MHVPLEFEAVVMQDGSEEMAEVVEDCVCPGGVERGSVS